MVEAAIRGVVDFREADPEDRRWWFKLRLALDHVENEGIARMQRLYYDYSLAVLSRDTLTERSSKDFLKDAEKYLFRLVNLWRPWEQHDPAQGQQAQADALALAWDREFGDRNDPETQAAIAETVRMLELTDRARKQRHGPTVRG